LTLPNFLHIGASKAASSWLWRVCRDHPEIYVPPDHDNVNFFTVHYHRGMDWYRETYFSDAEEEPAVGEFSNSYMVYRPALMRASRHLPGVRLTMTLRDPVQSLYLAWAHTHLKDKPYGFDGRKGRGIPLEKCLHHHGHAWFRLYMEPRFYARHLRHILELFPPERVHVMIYDDLREEPEGFLRGFFNFLDLDSDFRTDLLHTEINPDSKDADIHRDLSPDLVAELHRVYESDIADLEKLLGRSLESWRLDQGVSGCV